MILTCDKTLQLTMNSFLTHYDLYLTCYHNLFTATICIITILTPPPIPSPPPGLTLDLAPAAGTKTWTHVPGPRSHQILILTC